MLFVIGYFNLAVWGPTDDAGGAFCKDIFLSLQVSFRDGEGNFG